MANIFDYISWRGDLDLKASPFNEIDNLILARFSYFPFDGILENNEVISIKEAYHRFQQGDLSSKRILQKEDIDLFPALATCERFSSMKITKYVNKIKADEEKQFSAITILMPDDTLYVSYRGTDNTLVGWKEDFNMSFKTNIPSQFDAVSYLEEVSSLYPNSLRIGGHSKGGNLAVYASAFCNTKTKQKIIAIYNNDGPGFDEVITSDMQYQEILPKLYTYVPQTSIIGRLLGHAEQFTVVESTQSGLMQHDVYTWQVQSKEFIHLDEVDKNSQFIDKTIKDWLSSVNPAQREEFINLLFKIINTTDADTLTEMKSQWFKNTRTLLNSYRHMEPESKKVITQTLDTLFSIIKNNLMEKVPKLTDKKEKPKLIS